ncbi:MAG: YdcF family protein [Actinomycetota bacterium]|nr:YdcF family protein [Actinomycetota bacterium]
MKEAAAPTSSLSEDLRLLIWSYRGDSMLEEAPAEASRVVVVLGTHVSPGGRPSKPLQARTRHAARLYTEGEATLVIPTGGVGQHPPSEAEVMARILREEGVPEEAVLTEEKARSTRESAQLVGALARERGIQHLTVVTDPLHCVRAVGAFRAEGILACASPVYSSPMWRIRRMRRGQFFREIGALIWYKAREGGAIKRAGLRSLPL